MPACLPVSSDRPHVVRSNKTTQRCSLLVSFHSFYSTTCGVCFMCWQIKTNAHEHRIYFILNYPSLSAHGNSFSLWNACAQSVCEIKWFFNFATTNQRESSRFRIGWNSRKFQRKKNHKHIRANDSSNTCLLFRLSFLWLLSRQTEYSACTPSVCAIYFTRSQSNTRDMLNCQTLSIDIDTLTHKAETERETERMK